MANFRAVTVAFATLLFSGCGFFGPSDGPPPPPDRLVAVEAACDACTPAQAMHPCPPRRVGDILCSGIPAARVGETMILCAEGAAGSGAIGRIEWSSSDPRVATVTRATFTVTHCVAEVSNAVLEAKAPGTASIIAKELQGSTIVRTALSPVTVIP